MKRDMDAIRSILLKLEKDESIGGLDLEEKVVLHHLDLMIDADLVEGKVLRDGDSELVGAVVQKITWKGYDFLDAAKNEAVWMRTKAYVLEKGGGLTLDIAIALAKKFAFQHLGLPPE